MWILTFKSLSVSALSYLESGKNTPLLVKADSYAYYDAGESTHFFRWFVDGWPIANAVTNSTDWEREAHAFLSLDFERLVRLPWKRYNQWQVMKYIKMDECERDWYPAGILFLMWCFLFRVIQRPSSPSYFRFFELGFLLLKRGQTK